MGACEGVRTACGSHFSPSAMWVCMGPDHVLSMKFMFENAVKYSLQKNSHHYGAFYTFVILGWATFKVTFYCIQTLGTHGLQVD